MCDFFWPSPADHQGDLSDVVRASLQQQQLPALPAVVTSPWLDAGQDQLPEEDAGKLLLLHGHGRDQVLSQQQLAHGHGSNSSSSCDPPLCLLPYPQLDEPLQMEEGVIRHVMSSSGAPPPPLPQLLAAGASGGGVVAEGECDVAAAPPEVVDEHEHGLDVAMVDALPHRAHDAPTINRRKSQTKKVVVCIPAPTAAPPGVGGRLSTSGGEVVPSDLWAWRKYGQKPIKGSPYPRGYYRCSSSKGCSARKQVERSRTDPSMLVITYSSDHNHPWPTQRNALAGSTRQPTAAGKSHHHQRHSAVPPPLPRHRSTTIVAGDSSVSSIGNNNVHHHQQQPKQEVLDVMEHPVNRTELDDAAAADHDYDLEMFEEMDGALNINFNPQKQGQQNATAADDDDHSLERDDKQQLLDPFTFSFFDWVGASFGIGDANKGGGYI